MNFLHKIAIVAFSVGMLTACGGGGNDTPPQLTNTSNNTFIEIKCALGEVNVSGVCRSAENICTAEAEKSWVRGYLDDFYLWYDEIPERKATDYATPRNYFDALLVKDKDRFSYTMSEEEADGFFESGLQLSYGVLWGYETDNTLRVRFVEPNSKAAQAGVIRGDYVISINNQMIDTLTYQQVNELLTPKNAVPVNVKLMANYSGIIKDVTLQGENIVTSPVPYYSVLPAQSNQDKVGYLLFNDHVATASNKLIEAVSYFKQQQITDLVLDLRFNSGGYIYIANELAAMIGGNKTEGQLFTKFIYNNKYLADYYYYTKTSYPSRQPLPYLNLSRLFVLTSDETCSASEAIINSLSPFMPVIKIGSATCGKPYGMEGATNCDVAYFAITFKGENAYGQSVPTTGYTPTCQAYETLNDQLGSPQEGLLASALYYRDTGNCLMNNAIQSAKLVNTTKIKPLAKPKWQNNMIFSGNHND